MDKSVSIRPARPDDAARLSDLAGQLGYPCREEDVRERATIFAAQKDGTILVAEAAGLVVGWTSLETVTHFYLDPFVEISGFVVDKDYRNQGVGKALMSAAEGWVQSKGLDLLRLKTNALRKEAHRFYENLGFKKTKEQYVYVKTIGTRPDKNPRRVDGVQKRMYERADIYDLQNSKDRADIAFYKTLAARAGGPILELACGTGILSIPIAQEGVRITGLDISKEMVARAREQAKAMDKIDFIVGDMTKIDLPGKYTMVFLGFNSVCHLLDYASVVGMLASVRGILEERGSFFIDCFVPNPEFLVRESGRRYPVFSENGLKIEETNEYDPITQINHIIWHHEYRGESWIEPLDMRIFYPAELRNYIEVNGFKIVQEYGDHSFSKLTKDSPLQIYECRLAGC